MLKRCIGMMDQQLVILLRAMAKFFFIISNLHNVCMDRWMMNHTTVPRLDFSRRNDDLMEELLRLGTRFNSADDIG